MLSTAGARADAIALTGTTAYWTEQVGAAAPVARSAGVPGSATAAENRLLEPVSIPAARSRCALRKGTTIAASPHVRVLRSRLARLLCRVGSKRVTALGRQAGPLQIAADRWLLTRSRGGKSERLAVLDTKTAKP